MTRDKYDVTTTTYSRQLVVNYDTRQVRHDNNRQLQRKASTTRHTTDNYDTRPTISTQNHLISAIVVRVTTVTARRR